MLRSLDQIQADAQADRVIVSDAGHAVLAGGGGGYQTPWHWHDCLMVLLPSCGSLRFADETKESGFWLTDGRFVVVPSGVAHETRAMLARHAHIAIYLSDRNLRQFEAKLGSMSRLRQKVRRPAQYSVTPEIRSLQMLCSAGGARVPVVSAARDCIAAAMLIQCLVQIEHSDALNQASLEAHGEAVVSEIRAFIDSRTSENLSLDMIADAFGLSRRHVTRLFRERLGLTIGQYRERRRVEQARRLLTETTLPIGEIAARVGFETGSSLARVMRRATGDAPRKLRNLSPESRSDKY